MKTRNEMVYDFMLALASNEVFFGPENTLSMVGVAEEVGLQAQSLADDYLAFINGDRS
jgi:hypothetical protein